VVVGWQGLEAWRGLGGEHRCSFIVGLRRFVARGEDKLESTAADCALVFFHSGRLALNVVREREVAQLRRL
jgi:hypothetical protein